MKVYQLIMAVFVLGIVSCGGGHTCDAYRTADYSKYKSEKTIQNEAYKVAKLVRD